ncbi:MAG: response regulator [Sphingomonas sp.]|uniref:response regulator n=1 Tax=Sphingomonas sp. TaxID=28214 RepID=UPI002276ACEC|nr:response regulator [Sphingomonas sp.]MCX8476983.1 response regulator [Sphingomonas sp.]
MHAQSSSGIADERRTVLVVEDDLRIRLQLAHCLRADGYAVVEAGTADQAVRILAADRRIGCVFSDVQMPGALSGADLARWVMLNRPGLGVILASGGLREEQVVASLEGEVPFLAKPFRYARVRDLLDMIFGEPRARIDCEVKEGSVTDVQALPAKRSEHSWECTTP